MRKILTQVLILLLVGAVISSLYCMPVLAAISDEDFKKKLSNEYDRLSNAKLSVMETSSSSGHVVLLDENGDKHDCEVTVALDSVEVRKLAGGTQTTTTSKVNVKKDGKILDQGIIKKVKIGMGISNVVKIFFGFGKEANNPQSYVTIEIVNNGAESYVKYFRVHLSENLTVALKDTASFAGRALLATAFGPMLGPWGWVFTGALALTVIVIYEAMYYAEKIMTEAWTLKSNSLTVMLSATQ